MHTPRSTHRLSPFQADHRDRPVREGPLARLPPPSAYAAGVRGQLSLPPPLPPSHTHHHRQPAHAPPPRYRMAKQEVEERSHYLIARVMSATEKRIQRIMSASGGSRASSAATRRASSALTAYSDTDGKEQEWNVAEDLVAKIIGTWTVSDRWKHCTNRIGRIEVKYLFELIFSIPTRRRPIPNATASVLFAVDPGSGGIEGMLRAQSAVSVDNSAHVLDIGPPPDAVRAASRSRSRFDWVASDGL